MKKKTPKNFNETQVIGCSSVIILGLYKKIKCQKQLKQCLQPENTKNTQSEEEYIGGTINLVLF